jgi:NAD(P)-dependent dehydrogenase (short-subunit alcohol dehydrogenase family)
MSDSDNGFAGRAYVVSGGTQGIGAAVAVALAGSGAGGVVICGRHEENGARVKSAVEAIGCACEYVRADLAEADDCRAVTAACDRRFGRLDGLVNAAGITDRGTIENTSVELWDRMFAVNVRAPFILTQDAISLMRRERIAGGIVNIITMSSHGGQPFITAYSASKGALATLTKNVAHAVRADRIRVNGVNMGWADTPNEHRVKMTEGLPENWLEGAEASQPFGRLIKPEDIARICLFLLGPQSGLMTGAVIDYDQNVMGAYD